MGEEMMASMKNGEGGEYFMHFTCEVAVGKVLDENPLSNPHEYLDDVPEKFRAFKDELALFKNNASFFWRKINQSSWQALPDKLKRLQLMGFFQEGAVTYKSLLKTIMKEKLISILLRQFSNR